jgi:putative ABC transport system permease protein
VRVLLVRVLGLIRGRRLDADLDDEVRFHLDMAIDEYVRRGLSRDEARAAALRNFGGVMQVKERHRDQRGLPWLDMLIQDLRYGLRTLARTPGFTVAALLTLALGIGANTAMFTVVNAVLLRPLPFFQPDRLVQLVRRYPGQVGRSQDGRRYLFFRDHLKLIEALSAHAGLGSLNLVYGNAAEFVRATGVSKEYFTVFGVRPELGETFTAEHDVTGGPDVVVLGHALWQRSFGGDPAVLGRSVLLGDKPHTVIGVLPASFEPISPADLFLPLRPGLTGRGGGFNYAVTARLRPATSIERASAEVAAVWQSLSAEFPKAIMRSEIPSGFLSLQETMAISVKPALLVMSGAVGLLLLIACANTANLLLARASGRGRELALRAALGAGRGRIVRQMLTESVLLAVLGALLGLLLAHWTVPLLLSLTPSSYLVTNDVRIDTTVLIVAMLVAVSTGIIFGLAPAMAISKRDLVGAFRDDGTRSVGSRQSSWLRGGLVIGEVALCMLLLVGAGLMIQTFLNLRAADPGFDPRGLLSARMSLQGERYSTPEAVNRLYDEGLERIRRIPGVRAAAVVNGLPLEPALNLNVDVLDGPPDEQVQDVLTDWRYATSDYFETMGIKIVAGRGFSAQDRAGQPPVAVVSEEFARRLFKGHGALGRHIRIYPADGSIEIVGIAKDLLEGGLRNSRQLVMYVPVAQTHATAIRTAHSYFQVCWVIRADQPGATLIHQVEDQMRSVDPKQPFSAFRTMDEVKSRAMSVERFQMTLLGILAAIGLLLATAGIYGLVAYSVSQRTREIGIRMALGATRDRILRSVLRQAAILSGAGVVLGLLAALISTRTLQAFVWNVSTIDPATFALVAALLVAVALLAAVVPALRAVRLNPVQALRD